MTSACGRYVICFNGGSTISEIAKDLSMTSDTEIRSHPQAFALGSISFIVNGMFAFAIWDKKSIA